MTDIVFIFGISSTYKHPNCDTILSGGGHGCVLLKDGDILTHYDINKKRRLNTAKFSGIKRVCWNPDKTMVALASKFSIYICDSNLKVITSYKSRTPVKSFLWHRESGRVLKTYKWDQTD